MNLNIYVLLSLSFSHWNSKQSYFALVLPALILSLLIRVQIIRI